MDLPKPLVKMHVVMFLLRFLRVWVVFCRRLGFQHGDRVPVPQLEGVCADLFPSLCGCSRWAGVHARKSPFPPGGNRIVHDGLLVGHIGFYPIFSHKCIWI